MSARVLPFRPRVEVPSLDDCHIDQYPGVDCANLVAVDGAGDVLFEVRMPAECVTPVFIGRLTDLARECVAPR